MEVKNMNSTRIGLAILGFLSGGFIGFLLRPSSALVGQLPFAVVITRGAVLKGLDALLIPLAEQSFNSTLAGSIIGLLGGIIISYLIVKGSVQEPFNTNQITKKERPSVKCKNCGANLKATAKFCEECGATVTSKSSLHSVCPECNSNLKAGASFCEECGCNISTGSNGSVIPDEPLICSSCGAKLKAGGKFCEDCGKSVSKKKS